MTIRLRAKRKTKRQRTDAPPVGWRVMPNGSRLRIGGTNRGPAGPPPDLVRAAARMAAAERIHVLTAIMDGKPLRCVRPMVVGQGKDKGSVVEIVEWSAPADAEARIRAWAALAQIGVPARQEITGADGGPVELTAVQLTEDERRARLEQLLAEARSRLAGQEVAPVAPPVVSPALPVSTPDPVSLDQGGG